MTGSRDDTAVRLSLRGDDVSWTPAEDGSVIVLDLRTSRYSTLNGPASALWTRLAEGATEADLVTVITARWGVDDDLARRDVVAFLADLRARELVS